VVADQAASRRHALIQRSAEAYWIDDLGSSNGTWVNRDRVTEPRRLKDGDMIHIGDTRLVFQLVTETLQHASPHPTETGSTTNVNQGSGAAIDRHPGQ
jgi:pSer/pThr/pTyr-binding forkhead associated (FHA) protein